MSRVKKRMTLRCILLACFGFAFRIECVAAFAFPQKPALKFSPIDRNDETLETTKEAPSFFVPTEKTKQDWPLIENEGFESYGCVSRRKAAITSFSLLTIASVAPIRNAVAENDTPTAEPFRVLFTIQLDSTKPNELSELEIEVRPDWAPLAADRFAKLVDLGFYQDSPFFRVLPGYVAQFGISADPSLNKEWMYCDPEAKEKCKPPLPDEPRKQPNKKGTLAFASSGKNSRKNQVFINLANNDGPPNFLDAQGFTPFAKIVRGMEENNNIPKQLNAEYGGKVNQGKAAYYGGEYFKAVFPRLSVIKDAKRIS